ncbi:MAG: hypothetical protein KKE37_08065 [Verrucomicrobia bacterium]|nr:hypothetical protein [Verrucomicrobiota bacterium]
MKNEFKVIEWLRQVRDEYAEETHGLTDAERVRRLRKETESWTADFLRRNLTPSPETTIAAVHEARGKYKTSQGDGARKT